MGQNFLLLYVPGLGWACEVRAWAGPGQGLMGPRRTLVDSSRQFPHSALSLLAG